MALITDPDLLKQGAETAVASATWGTPSGNTVQVTGAGQPALDVGSFVEVRDHSDPENNGVYQVAVVNTSTSDYDLDKVGSAPIAAGAEAVTMLGDNTTEKNVFLDTSLKRIYLLEDIDSVLSVDGVTMRAIHSFIKIVWKSDDFLIAAGAFPMVGISFKAGQWELGKDPSGNANGWAFANDESTPVVIKSRRLVRNAGWDEIDAQGNTLKKFMNATTLPTSGAFEDPANDLAFYRFGSDPLVDDSVDFEFAGEVNEPVLYFDEIGNPDTWTLVDGGGGDDTATRATGSFITDGFKVGGQVTIRASNTPANDGTYLLTGVAALTLTVATGSWDTAEADAVAQVAVDNSNAMTVYSRVRDADPKGKTFSQATLDDAGETAVGSNVIKFGLSNVADQKIDETDANIDANTPYTQMAIRYFDQPFNREVDSATNRNFGIVIDVGTHSGVDGSAPGAASVLTTAEGGMTASLYDGGTLRIHEGTDENTTFPIVSNTATTITVTGTIASATDISFTAQRATPIVATNQEIYEFAQRQLRKTTDIDATDQVVIGRTADRLLAFVGDELRCGSLLPTNPNGGGSGVIIEGFDPNSTNDLKFTANDTVQYNYPFVAAGTLIFNQGLVDDTDGEYWLFFAYTTRTTNSDIDVTAPSGSSYTLTGTLPNMAVGEYIDISGFAQTENNGLFIIDVENTPSASYDITRVDGGLVGTTETDQTVNVDENPYPSPDAIIVDDAASADIAGAVGATSIGFDFDYDGNTQGGRTASTPAVVRLFAAGLENAQAVVSPELTITQATGLTFSLTSPQERNYNNP